MLDEQAQAADRYFQEAVQAFSSAPGKEAYATKPLKEAAGFLVRAGMHASAMKLYQYLLRTFAALKQPHNVRKAVLCRAVLLLAAGDPVAAEGEFQFALDVDGFASSREAEAIESLVGAYKDGNTEEWTATIEKNTSIAYADRAIAALLRSMPAPGSGGADDEFAEALGEQAMKAAGGGASGRTAADRGLRSAEALGAKQSATAAPILGGSASGGR